MPAAHDTPQDDTGIGAGIVNVPVSPSKVDKVDFEEPTLPLNTPSAALSSPALPVLKRSTLVSIALVLGGLIVLANILNSTLMYDDGYLLKFFRLSLDRAGLWRTVPFVFFNLDIAPREYRLYGLSRLIHLLLWSFFGTHAWAYGGVIGTAQAASAWGIYRMLRRFHADAIQSGAVAIAWGFSFFANTTCFHHYSYLILPYDITIGCALILQKNHDQPKRWLWRLLAAAVCVAIAWTGEAHLLAAMAILVLVAAATPSAQTARQRWIDAAIPLAVIPAAASLHRWVWSKLVPVPADHPRYVFVMPSRQQFVERSAEFLASLYKGAAVQIQAIFTFAGPWIFVVGALLALCALSYLWYRPGQLRDWWTSGERRNCGIVLSVPMVPILLASLAVLWALSVFTGQISPVMPRRYGYVPYSLMTVVVLVFLTDPWMRRRVGMIPALVACGAAVYPWVVLQLACLPVVRSQDGRVWAAARTAMAGKVDPCVLFIDAWDHPDMPGFQLGAGTPGLRGSEFPEIFESPLMGYWWESQYADMVLGARYVGYRAVPEGPGRVRLYGNGLLMEESALIPTASLVVMADLGLNPPRQDAGVGHIVSLTTWDAFQSSVAAHPVAVESGWNGLLDLTPSEQSIIGLGEESGPSGGLLPDKRFSDPPHENGVIENYGLESGADNVFPAPSQQRPEPLAYFLSNRHGTFTYRLDFKDPRPKWVILDVLELWHLNAGERLMKVEAALDGRWFLVGMIDPAAEAGRMPLRIKFPVAGVKSFQIRLSKALNESDIPFLNGIRVVPMTDDWPHRVRPDLGFGPPSIAVDIQSGAVVSGAVTIGGWALDNASGVGTLIRSVQVLVDGVPAGNATYGLPRPDVCAGFPERPGCPNVGFNYQLNTAPLKKGPHQIAISATDSDPTPHTETATLLLTVR